MQENQIKPDKITKPIQLLAAWLIGLILLTSSLITAAATVTKPDWLPAFFAISSVSIIPIFLILIFLLQTKYRPEMQEDTFYSKYLDRNSMSFEYIDKKDEGDKEINILRDEIISISEKSKQELEELRKLIDTDGNKTKGEKVLETIIENSDNRLEELKRVAKIANIDLRINTKLPRYSEIIENIQKIGFINYNEFGHDKPLPVPITASFGRDVPLEIIRDIIFDLIRHGLTYIKETSSIAKMPRKNTIYLGSFSTSEKRIKIDDNIITKLSHIKPEMSFDDIFKK